MSNQDASFELELTINKRRTNPYDLGDGYGHLAFCVDDLSAEHVRITNAGYAPRKIVDFMKDDVLLAQFFFVQDPDGYEIEVMQKHGRYH
jgi:lactoylglutathione lyase